jgi:hypothetical protein
MFAKRTEVALRNPTLLRCRSLSGAVFRAEVIALNLMTPCGTTVSPLRAAVAVELAQIRTAERRAPCVTVANVER